MALSDELLAIRLELKGVRETVEGFKSVDKAQEGVAHSTTKAGAAATRAERKTSGLTRAYQSLGKTARWGLGFLGVGGVFALKSAVKNSEELAKTTTGLSRNLGLQTNVASRWGAVAHARGIDSKALSMAFGTLSSRMVEAGREGGTLLTPFHQMGLTQEEVAKGAHNFEWGLMRVTKALGDMEGGAKRTTAAKAAFGRGFQTVVPLMAEGTKGLKESLHWADKYGVTLDGNTNEALMDMVQAQRESKVATLGLQLALTKALMPAIEGGQHELQKFIATLNDPDMSGDEKIAAIERQFEHLEDKLVDVLADALPAIAEHGGELGVKLAGALWHGFWQSDLGGKLVIAAWIFHMFGGEALLKAGATRVGGVIGMRMGVGLAAGVSGFLIGWELGKLLEEKTHGEFHRWGINAAENFVNALIWGINKGMDEANLFSFLGVDAPEIGEVNFHDPRERMERGEHVIHQPLPPGQIPPGSEGPGITSPPPHTAHGGHRPHSIGGWRPRTPSSTHRLPRAVTGRTQKLPTQSLPRERGWGRSRLGSVTVQVPLEGKVLAEKTVDIAELEASLK